MTRPKRLLLKLDASGHGWLGRQPLGLSTLPKSSVPSSPAVKRDSPAPVPRAPRGSKGITSYGRSQVRNAATELQLKFKKHNLAFLTLTVPFTSREDLAAVYKNWSRAVGNFENRLRRALPSDLQHWVHVTEDQKRGAPHLHMAFPGRRARGQKWILSKCWFTDTWREIWEHILPSSSRKLVWDYATRIESIRKSVAGYLGKYMSKGGVPKNPDCFPSSWWGCTQELKRLVVESTFRAVLEPYKIDWDRHLEILINSVNIRSLNFYELPSGMTWGISFRVDPDWSWKVASDFLIAYQE